MSSNSIKRNLVIYINDKQVKNNLKSIRSEMNRLRREISLTTRGTKEYSQKTAELQRVKKIYRDMRKEIEGVPGIFQRMTKSAGSFMAMVGVGFGINALITKLTQLTQINARLSDAQANVAKTTNLNSREIDQLTKNLKALDTRTPLEGLLGIAEEAGRLGKRGVQDITEFVKVADKIGVALGDDLQGDINENVRLIGKLVDIYKVGEKEGKTFGESMDMVGSAINAVSASGSENAGFMVEFLKRMAGVSQAADIAADSMIGFAAVLDENGQSVEVSGTSMNKVILDMFTNTEKYAKIAGMSVSDFSDLLNKDANEAVLKFLEGVNKDNAGLQQMAGHFDTLGIKGARTVGILTTLAKNTDAIREKQALANNEMQKATSLTDEFNQKNNNLAGNLAKINKWFTNIFVKGAIRDGLTSLTSGFMKFVGITKESWVNIEKNAIELKSLELQLYQTNIPHNERVEIIKKLQEKYPKYLKNLDAETATNEMLSIAINKTNDELINKIILLKKEAEINEQRNKVADIGNEALELEMKLNKSIVAQAKNYGVEVKDLGNNLEEQINNIIKVVESSEKGAAGSYGASIISQSINDLKNDLYKLKELKKAAMLELNSMEKDKENLKTMLGINDDGSKNDPSKSLADIMSYQPKSTDTDATTKTDTTKTKAHSAGIKSEKDYQAELLRIQREAKDAQIEAMDAGYAKEKAKLDEIYTRKIADAEKRKATDKEIKAASPKDQKILIEQNKQLDSIIESYRAIHLKKLEALNEKYRQKQLQKEQAAYERKLKLLKAEQNETLASIQTMADAKKYLTDEELKGVKNVNQAKKILQEKFDKEQEQMQMEHLQKLIDESQKILEQDKLQLVDLTDEQKEALLNKIAELKLKLSELKVNIHAAGDGEEQVDLGAAGDLDILGFSVEQWDETFSNLDTTKQKIAAAEMAIQGIMNAWKMYSDFQQANAARELKQYEASLDKKKKKLKEQLDHGYITEKQYHDKLAKLDADLDRKKAELAYNQAKREKQMNLFNAISATALGVTKALPNIALAAIVGALGAMQIATIAATPLPEKGYAEGGFTTGMGFIDDSGHEVAGVVHANEYVVPEFVMSDPAVPAIIQYLEAKRTGQSFAEGGEVKPAETTDNDPNSELTALNISLNRLNDLLDKGIEAKLFFGNKEAYEVDQLIKENQKLYDNAKF